MGKERTTEERHSEQGSLNVSPVIIYILAIFFLFFFAKYSGNLLYKIFTGDNSEV